MVTIVDLGISNIGSVAGAFRRLGASPCVTADADEIERAEAIVLPGVGAFGDGVKALSERGLIDPLRRAARTGKPFLGLCLGMQLLADSSEEYGHHTGLALVPGRVVKLQPGPGERVPNIGWCDVSPRSAARLFRGPRSDVTLYFVHSYHMICDNDGDVAATIRFGSSDVTAAVEHGNIFGLQCHPEKSQDAGFEILEMFLSIAGSATSR